MNVGDIIEKDGSFEIVISIGAHGIEKVPLRDHVMNCYMINHNGNFISIKELVNDLMNEIINKNTTDQ